MKYTSEGVQKNWDGKNSQTYEWALITAFKDKVLKDIAFSDMIMLMLATASTKKLEYFEKYSFVTCEKLVRRCHKRFFSRYATWRSERGWGEFCNLHEGKQNELIKAYTSCRVKTSYG